MRPSKDPSLELDSSAGEWLFRKGELVLGPVPAAALADQLYAGEIDARTEVRLLQGDRFVRLDEVDLFQVHLARAEAKRRVDAQARSRGAVERRRRNLRLGVLASLALALAAGAAAAARHLVIHRPWKGAEELALSDISVDAPKISISPRSRAAFQEEELVDYPGGDKLRRERSLDRARAATGRLTRSTRANSEADDAEGMQMATLDQSGISAVVAARQKSLYPCVAAITQKRPNFSAKIPIEFVIGNDGKVVKVWVDHPDFKEGTLPECLLKELQKWPFKPYDGERATVGLQFRVGKGG